MNEWMNEWVLCSYFIWADSFELCGALCNLERCHDSIVPPNNYFFLCFFSDSVYGWKTREFDSMVISNVFCRIKECFWAITKRENHNKKFLFFCFHGSKISAFLSFGILSLLFRCTFIIYDFIYIREKAIVREDLRFDTFSRYSMSEIIYPKNSKLHKLLLEIYIIVFLAKPKHLM